MIQPWHPITDPRLLRRLGKLGEELGELSAVVSRCIIQGVTETDPATDLLNYTRLWNEIADVRVQMDLAVETFALPTGPMQERYIRKRAQMAEWSAAVNEEQFP